MPSRTAELQSQAADANTERKANRDRTGYRSGGSAITAKERQTAASQSKLGEKIRRSEAAAYALEQAADVAAATGIKITPETEWSYRKERLTLADAREILADAGKAKAASGRGRILGTRSSEKMTDRELWAILTSAASATAATVNRRTNRDNRLTEEDFRELRSWLALEACRKGAPRWRAIGEDDTAAAAAATLRGAQLADSFRQRWIAYLILRGRTWSGARLAKMKAETAATEELSTEDVIAAETAATGATVEAISTAVEAIGAPLGKQERLTLSHAITGLTRRELAEREGHSPDYVKTAVKRGRSDLERRLKSPRIARRMFTGAADAETLNGLDRASDVLRWIEHAPEGAAAAFESELAAVMLQREHTRDLPARKSATRHGSPADVLRWIDYAEARLDGVRPPAPIYPTTPVVKFPVSPLKLAAEVTYVPALPNGEMGTGAVLAARDERERAARRAAHRAKYAGRTSLDIAFQEWKAARAAAAA